MSHKIPSYYRYVESVTVSNAGSGYVPNTPPTISFTGGGGTNAAATAVVGPSGQIVSVTITNPGTGYTTAPTVTVSGSGGAVLTAVLSFASGDTTEHVEKNADNIKYSIPEFIREDYTTFVTFIEKYYQWMDRPGNPINVLLNKRFYDIDEANSTEIEKWRQMLAKRWPSNLPVDKKFFYKNIKYLYESKGSKASVETFFRLFYGEDVSILYPSRYILRASDGIWKEKQSVKVISNNNYEVLNLKGALIDIHYYVSFGSGYRTQVVPATVTDVIKIDATSPQQWEVFLKFDTLRTSIPGPGADAAGTIVFEGPIATVDTIGVADVSRSAGTYTIGASDWTSSGAGSLAEFTVVVDGSGDATVTIDVDGQGFVIDETITIADANLGGGGGADLTFDVATLVEGQLKVNDILITNTGIGYVAAPTVSIIDTGTGSDATARLTLNTTTEKIRDAIITNKGTLYNSTTTSLTINNLNIDSFITLRGSSVARSSLVRSLASVSSGTYSGSGTPTFRVGDVFLINESGDDDRGYALDYFAEDYVIIGGSNNAFVKVETVSSGIPTSFAVITAGYNFNVGSAVISLTDSLGESVNVTINSGYLFSYQGEYTDDRGKLSDVNRLQDNRKYQTYSYIVKSTHAQSEWNRDLRDTVHPAGWEVFGELVITNEISFEDFDITVPQVHFRFFEEDIFAGEGGETSESFSIEYEISFSETVTKTDVVTKLISPSYTDATTNIRESDAGTQTYFAEDYVDNDFYVRDGGIYFSYGKNVSDSATTLETVVKTVQWNRDFADSAIVTDVISTQLTLIRTFSDATSNTDSATLHISKSFTDNAHSDDATFLNLDLQHETAVDDITNSDISVINTSKPISDTGTTSEIVAKNFTTSRSDTTTTSDSGTITGPQDYVDITYFAEDYIVGTTLGSF